MKKNTIIKQKNINQQVYNEAINIYGLTKLQAEIISRRINDVNHIKKIINPSFSNLQNPLELLDMRKAAERIVKAIEKEDTVLFAVDYDQDGIGSGAVLYSAMIDLFKVNPKNVHIHVTNRMEHGYGFKKGTVDAIFDKILPDVIVTADQGSSDRDGISHAYQKALELGKKIDIIVTDHHHISEDTPATNAYAFVNPQREGDPYYDKNICGAFVSFLLMLSVRMIFKEKQHPLGKADIMKIIDFTAPATIADCMDLKSENNRISVRYGIHQMNLGMRPAWRAVRSLNESPNEPITVATIGWQLAPKVNSESRMGGSGFDALKFLITKSDEVAHQFLKKITLTNERRKESQKELEIRSYQYAEKLVSEHKRVLIIPILDVENVYGITGIVASRVVEKYNRPTIILSKKPDGTVTGSGRSIEGFDIRSAVYRTQQKRNTLLAYGGHPAAMGVSLLEEYIEPFVYDLEEEAMKQYPNDDLMTPIINVDGSFPKGVSIDVMAYQEIQQLQPYGVGFEPPLFVDDVTVLELRIIGKTKTHLSFVAQFSDGQKVKALMFNALKKIGDSPEFTSGDKVKIVYELERNFFRGKESQQLMIKTLKAL